MAFPMMEQRRQLKSILRARFRNIISVANLPPDPAGLGRQLHPFFAGTGPDVSYIPGDPGPSSVERHPNVEFAQAEFAGLWMEFDRSCGGYTYDAEFMVAAGPEMVGPRHVGVHSGGDGVNARDAPKGRERNSAGQYSPLAKMSMEEWMKEGQRKRASAGSGGTFDELAVVTGDEEDSSGEYTGASDDSEDDKATEDWDAVPVRRGAASPVIAALRGRRKAVLRVFAQMGHVVGNKRGEPKGGGEGEEEEKDERFLDLGLRGSEDYHMFHKSMAKGDSPVLGMEASGLDLSLRGSFTHRVGRPETPRPNLLRSYHTLSNLSHETILKVKSPRKGNATTTIRDLFSKAKTRSSRKLRLAKD